MSFEVIGNGRTADVLKYDENSVIKLFKPFMKKEYIDQEFEISLFAFNNNVNTPKPISIINENSRIGIIYKKISGKSLLQELSDNPLQMPKIASKMAQLHYDIHQITYENKINTQKIQLKKAIQSVSSLNENDKIRIIDYLLSLPENNCLCHNDLHPDNILVNDKLWIIDWMTGSSGHPLCDIARSKLIIETSEVPESVPFLMRYLLKFGQKKLAERYVMEYCRIGKINKKDINCWLLPLYTARLIENLSKIETKIIIKKIRKEMKRKLTTISTVCHEKAY